MKKTTVFILALLFLISPAYAHPGRTDSDGGHHVSGTGEYHYHHGYPAHQHINGVCPYDFDDKTGSSSGSSSGSNSSSGGGSGSPTSVKKYPEVPTTTEEETKTPFWEYILIGLGIFIAGTPILLFLSDPIAGAVDIIRDRNREKKRREEDARRFNEERSYYIGLYTGKTIEELCDMPPDVEIGEDGLPKMKGYFGWGPRYTFYVSSHGSVFHRKSNCNAARKTKIHACSTWGYSPCKTCKPLRPDLRWFNKYRHIQAVCKTYNITLPILAPIEPPQPESALPSTDPAERPEE